MGAGTRRFESYRSDVISTGLSLDDRPVQPIRRGDRWICPVDGDEVLQLANGKFTHKPSRAFLNAFGQTLEQWVAERERDM